MDGHWLTRGFVLRGVLLLATAFSTCPHISFAQNAQLSGAVTDAANAVLPKAQIRIQKEDTGVEWHFLSNGEGYYVVPSVTPGSYRITVQAEGFKTEVVDHFKVEVGGKFSLDFHLKPGSLDQTITVDGSAIQLNTTDATVSTVIDHQFVSNLPMNGRTFQSLMAAVPGVSVVPTATGPGFSGEISVNGQRAEGNYFTVDGVSANTGQSATSTVGYGAGFSGATPQETVLGTTQSIVTLDALQEFRATTSTYSAEHGRTPGGEFSFQTRSGGNQVHGSVYDYLRNGALDAANFFNAYNRATPLPKPAERQNDFGGTLGGPIFLPHFYNGRDRSFFFFAYEGLRLQLPQTVTQMLVPTAELRSKAPAAMQAFLNTFPVSTDTKLDQNLQYYSTTYSAPSTVDATSVRIDHSISDRWKVFGRFSNTPSDAASRYYNASQNGGNLSVETPTNGLVRYVTGGVTGLLTSHISNELRVNGTWNNSVSTYRSTNFAGATPLKVESLPGMDSLGQLNFYLQWKAPYPLLVLKKQTSKQNQFNLVDSVAWTLGRHHLRLGVDYRRLHNDVSLPSAWEIGFFTNVTQVSGNAPATGQVRRYFGKMEPVYKNLSLFAQDEWSVNSRLSLSYGLRWDVNPSPQDATGNQPYTVTSTDLATLKVAAKGSELWGTRYTNFGPRLGAAYQLNNRTGHETVLRGGFGLYYDLGSSTASSGYNGVGIASIGAFNGKPMPFTQAQVSSVVQAPVSAPYSATVFGFDPDLKLPYSLHWNGALEQKLGNEHKLTISYVGARGEHLLTTRQYYLNRIGNTNFSSSWPLVLVMNAGSSRYDALQAQVQRRLHHGLQTLFSYTWAHAIDNSTSNFTLYQLLRASSDFDVRHNFQASVTYDLPGRYHNAALDTVAGGWSLDGRVSARSALPVDVYTGSSYDAATGVQVYYHPNRVSTESLYIYNSSLPGGRSINPKAFVSVSGEGNAGRNVARAFNAVQTDLALRKQFAFAELMKLQFRAEAFNLLNHAIFGAIANQLTNTQFGQATSTQNNQLGGVNPLYQQGGPRSLQVALKLMF